MDFAYNIRSVTGQSSARNQPASRAGNFLHNEEDVVPTLSLRQYLDQMLSIQDPWVSSTFHLGDNAFQHIVLEVGRRHGQDGSRPALKRFQLTRPLLPGVFTVFTVFTAKVRELGLQLWQRHPRTQQNPNHSPKLTFGTLGNKRFTEVFEHLGVVMVVFARRAQQGLEFVTCERVGQHVESPTQWLLGYAVQEVCPRGSAIG
mmetsp:Transcript_38222/g.110288  ORF Transcript_38222/g.110288 Transcript_38222/m.110288 type:complete len:202 (+) Transcript_38222:1959-2564(+)